MNSETENPKNKSSELGNGARRLSGGSVSWGTNATFTFSTRVQETPTPRGFKAQEEASDAVLYTTLSSGSCHVMNVCRGSL